jgi:N-acetylneuraminate synthase/N,N'-diacetyllegionaminate synthase
MATVRIGDLEIGADATAVVIAEAGVNHDGDVDVAHQLVDIAADAGAHAVKFQTFDPAALVAKDAAAAPYQERSGASSQSDLLNSLTLPATAWAELQSHAAERGIAFLSTPFDLGSAHMLVEMGVPGLKVSSGELTNLTFLRALSKLGVPLMASTGMGNLAEVDAAVQACAEAPGLVLFHCVSAYPAPPAEANLRAIPAMAARYGIPVGWSDHTPGVATALAAVALGGTVLEKHFTLDRTRPGPDHMASLEPDELANYVAEVAIVTAALGDGVKRRQPSEEENATVVRRSWHAVRDLAAGSVLAPGDAIALRPETGVSAAVDVVGSRLTVDVVAGQPIPPGALDLVGGA